MRTVLVLIAMLAAAPFANAQSSAQTVWKWVDEHGVTHYSDRPVPGATKVELSGGKVGTTPPSYSPPPPPSTTRRTRETSESAYRAVTIVTPANGDAIVNTGGQVPVQVSIDPGLQPGHRLELYLDGAKVQGHSGETSFTLTEVYRGEHSLVAVITDASGKRLRESERVVFYVVQRSIAKPPVGPALRNPPPSRRSNALPKQQPSFAELNGDRLVQPVDPRTNRPAKSAS